MTLPTARDEAATDDRYDDQPDDEFPEAYEPPTWTTEQIWRAHSVPVQRRCATHRHP